MFSKINPKKIISDHLKTLVDCRTGRIRKRDVIAAFVFPGIIAVCLCLFGFPINKDITTILITCLSIFCPLLFNVQLLVYGLIEKKKEEKEPNLDLQRLLTETYYNISFGIFLSLLTILFLFVFYFELSRPFNLIIIDALRRYSLDKEFLVSFFNFIHFRSLFSFFVYYFSFVLLHNFLMVLKRVHILIDQDFKIPSS